MIEVTEIEKKHAIRILQVSPRRELKALCIIYFLVVLACAWDVALGSSISGTTPRWITVDELDRVLQERNPLIVDLRTPGEFIKGNLAGSTNVPVQDLIREPSLLDRFKNRPILLYCRTVNKTAHALSILERRGFQSIYALDGGYEVLKKQYFGKEKEGSRP